MFGRPLNAYRREASDVKPGLHKGRVEPTAGGHEMAKQTIPHPILMTPRLRLRQFREDDVEAIMEQAAQVPPHVDRLGLGGSVLLTSVTTSV